MKAIAWISGKLAIVSSILVVLICVILAAPCLIGFRPYTVLSGSMEPEIHVASLVYINTRDKEAEIGKVVAFRIATTGEDSFVVHRIVDQTEKGYVTKGDNNDTEDMVILKPENIIGAYVYSIPYAGYLFANRVGILLLVFLWILGLNGIAFITDKFS
ncbi:MAG: signal peptidase I [Clostridiales bacterium]|nr:signal peptidase I [Clostridiales bacterium]